MARVQHAIAPSRPAQLTLRGASLEVVRAILSGKLSHKSLKDAFDWENTPEGHAWWSKVRQAESLSLEAAKKLDAALGRSLNALAA